MAFTLDNFVRSILAVDAAIGDTSLVVALAAPPLRDPPAPSAGAPGILILQDQPVAPTKIEIVTYTGVSIVGTQVTLTGVTRGLEGTSAQAWPAGTQTFSGTTVGVLAQFALAATLGTAAYQSTAAFATAAQGARADTALQNTVSFYVVPGGGPEIRLAFPVFSFNPNGAGATGLVGSWGNMIMLRAWKAPGDTSDYSDLTCNYNGDVTWRNNTIWHTGNFAPSSYMPKAGGTFTGSVLFPSSGGAFTIGLGTGDGATKSTYNTKIKAWNGIGFASFDDVVRGVYDSRSGSWLLDGSVTAATGTFSGNISAANFSGSHSGTSSGTNTGDQVVSRGGAANGRIFVQSTDPGAAAADGDLWIW